MATIGTTLPAPESGWKRYDDRDVNITYVGTWTKGEVSGYFNSTNMDSNSLSSYYEFGFEGSKLRIIDALASNRSANIQVTIDGVTESYSAYSASTTRGVLVYEKTGLEYGYHKVTVTNNAKDYMTLDAIDIDSDGELRVPYKKLAVKNPITNQHYSLADKTLILLPDGSDETIINYGLEAGKEIKLDEAFDKIKTVNSDGTFTDENVAPFSVYDHISETPELIIYNETEDDLIVSTTVEPYSVYDYISETPTVIAYTESTDDITVSTTTEPYDLYDEFGNEVEVLYYTDDEVVKEADLILDANWSPIDELKGDFEVVTWTDEPQASAQRVLELTAIPKPQFVRLVDPKRLYGYLDAVVAVDDSNSYRDEARYFITGTDTSKWYVWDKFSQKFVLADTSTNELVLKNGMKHTDLNSITDVQWRTWGGQYLNIGIFLKDNPRDTIVSVVDSLSYEDYLPRHSTTIDDTSLYILNTTAKIDLQMVGNTLTGVLSDDDLTRVQYRVFINGNSYFPSDGSFTALGASPQNIELTVQSKDIKIDDWNTIRVEFQDFFGTTDYWANSFMGTYSGLMFKDVYGQYYSSEIGEVLQNLDFGVITAGQTTIEHEVILKNQYGYDVSNVYLYANTSEFPDGMTIQFSESLSPFLPQPELKLNGILENNEEMSFFVRIKTTLGATPNADGAFDIIVRADRVY